MNSEKSRDAAHLNEGGGSETRFFINILSPTEQHKFTSVGERSGKVSGKQGIVIEIKQCHFQYNLFNVQNVM